MQIYHAIQAMLTEKTPGVLVTFLSASPTSSHLAGQHLIWSPDTAVELSHLPGELQEQLPDLCQLVLQKRQFERRRLETGDGWFDLMFEAILPAPRLVILGCGHVGQAVAKVAEIVGWELTAVDDRPTFANPNLFPAGTRVICADFRAAIESIKPGVNDYVVVVTRGHQYDRIVLQELAGQELAYLGMIGSKRRVRDLVEDLAVSGVSREWLAKLYSPVGLPIGAETPEEIAISIMAEIIQVRRKGAAR